MRRKISFHFFILLSIVILIIGAIFNIYINYLGKGAIWDLYFYAEIFWVFLSILLSLRAKSFKHLILIVIAFQFLDSFVDLIAMGHQSWWAGPPLLTEWQWGIVDTDPLLQQYWFFTWILQVPTRLITVAFVLVRHFKDKILLKFRLLALIFISAGLNIIWISSSQDFVFYVVWYGKYDLSFPYFFYLAPEGFWNLGNMLFLRIPVLYAISIVLIFVGKKILSENYEKYPKGTNK
jgi:hypothetical protein